MASRERLATNTSVGQTKHYQHMAALEKCKGCLVTERLPPPCQPQPSNKPSSLRGLIKK